MKIVLKTLQKKVRWSRWWKGRNIISSFLLMGVIFSALLAPVQMTIQLGHDRTNSQSMAVEVTPSVAYAQNLNSQAQETTTNVPLGACKWSNWSILGCAVQGTYWLLFYTTSTLASWSAQLFDFFLDYSTHPNSYKSNFVDEGWKVVRDISNIFFIFVLLYLAASIVMGIKIAEVKKKIVAVIVVALLINFSLFISRVLIDASNIFARIFYNNIEVVQTDVSLDNQGGTPPPDNSGSQITPPVEKSVSIAILSKINPQRLITEDVYTSIQEASGGSDTVLFAYMLFIVLLSTAVNVVFIYVFLKVALLFLARVIGLWLIMIFGPFAFVSYALPFNIPRFGHKEWWGQLAKLAFMAPAFLFFLYLVALFLDISFIQDALDQSSGSAGTDWQQKVMGILIPFAIIMGLLVAAEKVTKNMAGEVGKAVTKVAAVAGMAIGGAAAGGLALGGTALLGRAGAALARSKGVRTWATSTDKGFKGSFKRWAGGIGYGTGKRMSTGSYDVRASRVLQKAAGMAGVDLEKTFGKSVMQGGFERKRLEHQKRHYDRAQDLKVSDDEELKRKADEAEFRFKKFKNINNDTYSKLDYETDIAQSDLRDYIQNEEIEPLAQAALRSLRKAAFQFNKFGEGSKGLLTVNDLKKIADGMGYNVDERKELGKRYEEGLVGALSGQERALITDLKGNYKGDDRLINIDDAIPVEGRYKVQLEAEKGRAARAVERENNRRLEGTATRTRGTFNKVVNVITTGGTYSTKGANAVARSIERDVKEQGTAGGAIDGGSGGGE